MKIIVTGASGFVGTNLTLALAKNHDELLLIDDLSRPLVDKNRDYIELVTENRIQTIDITDTAAIIKIFDDLLPTISDPSPLTSRVSMSAPKSWNEKNEEGRPTCKRRS